MNNTHHNIQGLQGENEWSHFRKNKSTTFTKTIFNKISKHKSLKITDIKNRFITCYINNRDLKVPCPDTQITQKC